MQYICLVNVFISVQYICLVNVFISVQYICLVNVFISVQYICLVNVFISVQYICSAQTTVISMARYIRNVLFEMTTTNLWQILLKDRHLSNVLYEFVWHRRLFNDVIVNVGYATINNFLYVSVV